VDALSVIVPFFALVLIGYIAVRRRLLPVDSVSGLNAFVLYFALPAMLFRFGARTPLVQLLDPSTIGVWLVSGILLMGLAVATGLWQGRGWLDASFGGLIAVLPNSGFMGLPLIAALLGQQASGPIVTTLLVDIVVMQSIAVAVSQQGYAGSAATKTRTTLNRVLANPMPWAIVLGALWGTWGGPMPGPVDQVLTLLASAATPVALFTIGAVLAREGARPVPREGSGGGPLSADVWWLTALKLLLHPALVWALGGLAAYVGIPLEEGDLLVLVLVAALPSAANASILAERLGADNGRIAAVILLSTILGFATFTGSAILL
jgi:malonate transporter and related proteins